MRLAPFHLMQRPRLGEKFISLSSFHWAVPEINARCVPVARLNLLETSDKKCAGGTTQSAASVAVENVFNALGHRCGVENVPSADLTSLVVPHLIAKKVVMSEVRVTGCSSQLRAEDGHLYTFQPQSVLQDNDEDCWLSELGTIRGGVGEEWLEFSLSGESTGAENSRRRVEIVAMRIPCLPAGPNAVKCFHLEVPVDQAKGHDEDTFVRASDDLVMPTYSMHHAPYPESIQVPFVLFPAIEASRLRVVMTESHEMQHTTNECIGLWSIIFM